MWRNCKGFSLVEVLIALSVLSLTVATTAPMLVNVYQERLTAKEERQALEILHNRLQIWLLQGGGSGSDIVIHKPSQDFQLTWYVEGKKAKACILWQASNGRTYQKCGYAKVR